MYRDHDPELVEVTVDYLRRHGQAVLVKSADDDEIWIPISQIDAFESLNSDIQRGHIKRGDSIEIEIPEWLAKNEGLI